MLRPLCLVHASIACTIVTLHLAVTRSALVGNLKRSLPRAGRRKRRGRDRPRSQYLSTSTASDYCSRQLTWGVRSRASMQAAKRRGRSVERTALGSTVTTAMAVVIVLRGAGLDSTRRASRQSPQRRCRVVETAWLERCQRARAIEHLCHGLPARRIRLHHHFRQRHLAGGAMIMESQAAGGGQRMPAKKRESEKKRTKYLQPTPTPLATAVLTSSGLREWRARRAAVYGRVAQGQH